MCTNIAVTSAVHGVAKGQAGWFPINQATIGYDHATHSNNEHALLIDFVNYDIGTGARVAVELDLASGHALVAQLQAALEAAEASGVSEGATHVHLDGKVHQHT